MNVRIKREDQSMEGSTEREMEGRRGEMKFGLGGR
jgi:hypothetical protein